MGALILPSKFAQQPQQRALIDRSSPLGAKVLDCFPLNGEKTSLLGTPITYGPSGTTAAGRMGRSLRSSGSSARASAPMKFAGVPKISIAFWMYWDAFANDDALAFEFTTNATSPNGGFCFNPNSSGPGPGKLVFFGRTPGSDVAFATSFPRPTAGQWHRYVLNFDISGAVDLYIDTVLQPKVVELDSPQSGGFANSTLYLLSRADNALFGNGALQDMAFFTGPLTKNEVLLDYQNPWQLFKAPARRIWVAAPVAAVTGTLAVSEGADTASAAGTVVFPAITGTLARSEGFDTAAATGSVAYPAITGVSTASEGADTAAAAGAVAYQAITGSASIAEVADSAAGTGSVAFQAITGTLSQSEQADTSTAAGVVGNVVAGSVIASESPDTAAAAGSLAFPAITGTASRSEGDDTLAAAGTVVYAAISGSMSAAEQVDTALTTGTVAYPGVTGIAIASEPADTLTASGTVGNALIGSMLATEQPDTTTAAGTLGAVPITGAAAASEVADTALSSGSIAYPAISGSMSRAEAPDVLAGTGLVLSIIIGAASTAEARDTAAGYGIVTGGQAVIDASKIPPEHIVSFAGSVRVIPFPGTSRIVRF